MAFILRYIYRHVLKICAFCEAFLKVGITKCDTVEHIFRILQFREEKVLISRGTIIMGCLGDRGGRNR